MKPKRTSADVAAGTVQAIEAHQVLGDLMNQEVVVDGMRMSLREAYIRGLYRASLNRDMSAALELQKIRDAARVKVSPQAAGGLPVPKPMSNEEFEKFAFKQQAQFRSLKEGDGALAP